MTTIHAALELPSTDLSFNIVVRLLASLQNRDLDLEEVVRYGTVLGGTTPADSVTDVTRSGRKTRISLNILIKKNQTYFGLCEKSTGRGTAATLALRSKGSLTLAKAMSFLK